jgi:hypothetical protein
MNAQPTPVREKRRVSCPLLAVQPGFCEPGGPMPSPFRAEPTAWPTGNPEIRRNRLAVPRKGGPYGESRFMGSIRGDASYYTCCNSTTACGNSFQPYTQMFAAWPALNGFSGNPASSCISQSFSCGDHIVVLNECNGNSINIPITDHAGACATRSRQSWISQLQLLSRSAMLRSATHP